MMDQQPTDGYYNYPVVRRPVWTWEIPAYFWLGGIAGGAYVTASLAQNFGSAEDRRYLADGFYLAALAAIPCAPLLTADLGRPERFHHMLRVFKPSSPNASAMLRRLPQPRASHSTIISAACPLTPYSLSRSGPWQLLSGPCRK